MKKLIFISLLFAGSFVSAQQRVIKDAKGNYTVVKRDSVKTVDKPEGHTITDKDGKVLPLFISSRGKLYYMRTAKSGNVYRCYIKETD